MTKSIFGSVEMLNPHIKPAVHIDRQGEAFCVCECETVQNNAKKKRSIEHVGRGRAKLQGTLLKVLHWWMQQTPLQAH